MKRYEVPKALPPFKSNMQDPIAGSKTLLDGKAITRVGVKTFVGGLHEALIGAEVVGYVEVSFEDGTIRPALLVRRQRPFIPFGTDPKLVNKECARLFAIIAREQAGPYADGGRFDVVEVPS